MRPLSRDGKPMRALRELAGTIPEWPATERDVWYASRSARRVRWHAALDTLVERGLVERREWCGVYGWYITDAGRAELDARGFGGSS